MKLDKYFVLCILWFIMRSHTQNQQGCEVFFLRIGQHSEDSSQSGDAIVLTMGNRFSKNRNDYKIIVVDGAFAEDAKTIKEHLGVIGARNGSGQLQIDLMISSHCDQDHVSGLIALAEDDEVEIKDLWIHDCNGFGSNVQCSVEQAENLVEIAKQRDIPMQEPFSNSGLSYDPEGIDACIEILGPSREHYEHLMSSAEKGYERGKGKNAHSIGSISAGLYGRAISVLENIFNQELLRDPNSDDTSNSNNSSTVLLLKFSPGSESEALVLLTADAGVGALERAAPGLRKHGWHANRNSKFIQVPHHGSRRNVGPSILDAILGEKDINCERGTCCVSAHKNDESHPKRQVLNAFARRGYDHLSNEDRHICHRIGDTPNMMGWEPVSPVGLCAGEELEEHD